jgi:hypothetical protein
VSSSSPRAVRRRPVPSYVLVLLALVAPAVIGLTEQEVGSAASAAVASPSALGRAPAQRYITALVDKKVVRKGRKVKISGLVDAPDAPPCAANITLDVERSTHGAVYKVIDTVTTDGSGVYGVKEVVTKKARFRISAPATDACVAAQSPPRTVKLKGS